MFKFEKQCSSLHEIEALLYVTLGQNGKTSFSQLTLLVNHTVDCDMLNRIYRD